MDIIAKEFVAEYDKAIVSYLKDHHQTPNGEKAPTNIKTVQLDTHPLSNEECLYEQVSKAVVKKKLEYFGDSTLTLLVQNSVFSHKYGDLPGYMQALEDHSYILKEGFVQLVQTHRNDLYSAQAVQDFHNPIKKRILEGVVSYIKNIPEDKRKLLVDGILQKEKTHKEYLNNLLPKFSEKIELMYNDAMLMHIKPEKIEDVPYEVAVPTKEKIMAALSDLERNFSTYLQTTLENMDDLDIPLGNIKELVTTYFSEFDSIVATNEKLFLKKYSSLGFEMGKLLTRKIKEEINVADLFNPLDSIDSPAMKTSTIPKYDIPLDDFTKEYDFNDFNPEITKELTLPGGQKIPLNEVSIKELQDSGVKLMENPSSNELIIDMDTLKIPEISTTPSFPLQKNTDLDRIDFDTTNIQFKGPDGVTERLTNERYTQLKDQGIQFKSDALLADFDLSDLNRDLFGTPSIKTDPLDNLVNKEFGKDIFDNSLNIKKPFNDLNLKTDIGKPTFKTKKIDLGL